MEKVILRRCDSYDKERMRRIILEGIEELGLSPFGRVFIKPNVVFAHRRYGRYGYTHPTVLEAIIDVLKGKDNIGDITIGERTAVTIPTRFAFKNAGYNYLKGRNGVRFCFIDEDKKVEISLKKATLHKTLRLSKTFVNSDFKIYVPKLKNHASAKLTCALKLNIGILDSRERLMFHDWRLEEKIADLYEAGYPNFVVVDAVEIGQQGELVPKPLHLGAIIIGKNGIAVDSVCARIINQEPQNILHLKIARQRGWEPVSDDEIEIAGDIGLDELKYRTRNFDTKFNDLREVDFPVRLYLGNYPDGDTFCHTGCLNMLKTCFAIMDANEPGCLKKARPISIVVGNYKGDIDGSGLPIIFVGDCTEVDGRVKNGKIKRVGGCPVTVPFFMNTAAFYMRVRNPYIDPDAILYFPIYSGYSYLKKFLSLFL